MGITTDRNDPNLGVIKADGQQASYLVLSEEERAKGFVRPVRQSYKHIACGGVTTMGLALAETLAANPKFYSGTFCSHCGKHFNLGPPWNPNFLWEPDGDPVGSLAEEAEEFLAAKAEVEKAEIARFGPRQPSQATRVVVPDASPPKAHPSVEHVLKFFQYEHLPARLQAVSKPFAELAKQVAERSPANQETTVALRKLLESKDAAVRASL